MEIVTYLNDYLFYSYNIISEFISDPSSIEKTNKIKSFLEKRTLIDNKAYIQASFCGKEYFAPKINREILKLLDENEPLSVLHNEYLKKLIAGLEVSFANQITKRYKSEDAYLKLKKNELSLNNLLRQSTNHNTTEFLSLVKTLNQFLLEKTKQLNSSEVLNWKYTYVYLFVENYMQFLDNAKPTNNDTKDMLLMLQPYLKFKKNNLIPLMFFSKDNNIVLDTNTFPDEVHYQNFNDIGIGLPKVENFYFVNYFHKSIEKGALTSFFFHEVGHLIDLDFLNISSNIADSLYNDYNNIINNETDFRQWIRELVADAFGVCVFGWAFLFAQMFSINNDNLYVPTKSHPGIYFRVSILHSYLIQNNFGSLLDPYSIQEINKRLLELRDRFHVATAEQHELENILLQYISYLYKLVNEFLEASNNKISYDNIVEIISKNDGSISKALQYLENQEDSLKNYSIKQNLYWITRIKNS